MQSGIPVWVKRHTAYRKGYIRPSGNDIGRSTSVDIGLNIGHAEFSDRPRANVSENDQIDKPFQNAISERLQTVVVSFEDGSIETVVGTARDKMI